MNCFCLMTSAICNFWNFLIITICKPVRFENSFNFLFLKPNPSESKSYFEGEDEKFYFTFTKYSQKSQDKLSFSINIHSLSKDPPTLFLNKKSSLVCCHENNYRAEKNIEN